MGGGGESFIKAEYTAAAVFDTGFEPMGKRGKKRKENERPLFPIPEEQTGKGFAELFLKNARTGPKGGEGRGGRRKRRQT